MKIQSTYFAWITVLLFLLTPFVWSQSAPSVSIDELMSIIEFDTDLKEIHELIRSGDGVPKDRYYMLRGTVTAISTIDPNPDNFYSEVDFRSAQWEGTSRVTSYKIVLVFLDGSFAERLPQRPPRDPSSDVIQTNTKGIALTEFYDVITTPAGEVLPVFIVHFFTSLE